MTLGINGRFLGAPATGVQRFARAIVRRLGDHESVTLLAPRAVPVPREFEARMRVVRGRLSGHVWEQVELPRQARAERCNVVLHPANGAPSWGGRHVVVIHDVTPLTNPEWFARRFVLWNRLVLARAVRRAARVLAPSAWVCGELTRVLRIPAERIGVVSQGVEPFDAPAPPDAVARVRARYALPARYLLASGPADPRKNLAFLLEMMARWRLRSPPPLLAVVGGALPRIHRVPGSGAAGRADVRLLGHVPDDDLRALYTGAAAFCFPSLAEGFGRPPLEAMACGTPALAAEYGAAREVLGDGAVIAPLVADVWIDTLSRWLADDGERERQGARGRARAVRFGWAPAAAAVAEACRRAGSSCASPSSTIG